MIDKISKSKNINCDSRKYFWKSDVLFNNDKYNNERRYINIEVN